jgi:hypothetical protein
MILWRSSEGKGARVYVVTVMVDLQHRGKDQGLNTKREGAWTAFTGIYSILL